MEISFHSHLDSNTVIVTNFCTWHDSRAVVTCAKFCCDLMASNGVIARRIFHRIWITGKNPLVKRVTEPQQNTKRRGKVHNSMDMHIIHCCNLLLPNRRHALIWTNVGLVYYRIYVSLDLSEFKEWYKSSPGLRYFKAGACLISGEWQWECWFYTR